MKINNIIQSAYEKWKEREYVFEKREGVYQSITYGDFIAKVTGLATALINNGLKDKKIMVIGPNSIYYMITDLAVLAYVGTTVNVNFQTGKEELVSIVKSLGIDAIIYDERLENVLKEVQAEVQLVQCDSMQLLIDNIQITDPHFDFDEKDENACAKIIYSSGTTSTPKGIMLSLKNIFSGWEPLQKRTPFTEEDVVYLFLPLHHTYANIYNFLFSFLSGLRIYLSSGTENIGKELLEVNPTIFCAVPLIYKKLYEGYGDKISIAFGNRIKYLYCGGAKFDPELRKTYKLAGLPMFEAYALTETASSFSIEYPNQDDYESVGTIFENIDVKLLNQNEEGIGEIVVKGDNVFLGYTNNEELTKSVFTDDGYFITGDYGYIKDHKLYLTGRKSDVIIGENGENVYPKEIEKMLKSMSEDILKLHAFLVDSKVNYKIFVKENSSLDVEDLIQEYNAKATKKDCIKFYEIVYSNQTNLKG